MSSLPDQYAAVVIGAGGAIGGAIATALEADPRCGRVARFSRAGDPPVDVLDEASLAAAAERTADAVGAVSLLFVATGALILDGRSPEKALSQLDPDALTAAYRLNAVGPALAIKHFHRLTPRRGKSVMAALSARVGSVGDNRLGGWYGYRASKAALNQLLRSASVEIARKRPDAVVAALHPGTVESPLSAPFRPEGAAQDGVFTSEQSAARLLRALDALTSADSGSFIAYDGASIPW